MASSSTLRKKIAQEQRKGKDVLFPSTMILCKFRYWNLKKQENRL